MFRIALHKYFRILEYMYSCNTYLVRYTCMLNVLQWDSRKRIDKERYIYIYIHGVNKNEKLKRLCTHKEIHKKRLLDDRKRECFLYRTAHIF